MLLINAIIIMSTYCPKTLKGWKLQKRSLNDLNQSQPNLCLTKSYIIHAFQSTKRHHVIPSQPSKERYRIDSSQTKSMRLSNGFRRVKKQDYSASFSKILSDDRLIRISDFLKDFKKKGKTGQNADKSLPKTKQRHKKIRLMRSQIRKKPVQNSILNKLLLIKTPHQNNHRQTLFTDNEHPHLSQLEKEEFSPYRSKRQTNQQNQEKIIIPIQVCKKKQEQPYQNINFLSISQINLKQKQKLHRPKFIFKKRSFSVRQLKDCRQFQRNMARKSNVRGLIQPWQIQQKFSNN